MRPIGNTVMLNRQLDSMSSSGNVAMPTQHQSLFATLVAIGDPQWDNDRLIKNLRLLERRKASSIEGSQFREIDKQMNDIRRHLCRWKAVADIPIGATVKLEKWNEHHEEIMINNVYHLFVRQDDIECTEVQS